MLRVIEKDNVKMLVLNVGDEIIITSSKKNVGYTSVYNNGDSLVFDSTINKKNYNIPYQEREKMTMTKAIKEQERKKKVKV